MSGTCWLGTPTPASVGKPESWTTPCVIAGKVPLLSALAAVVPDPDALDCGADVTSAEDDADVTDAGVEEGSAEDGAADDGAGVDDAPCPSG